MSCALRKMTFYWQRGIFGAQGERSFEDCGSRRYTRASLDWHTQPAMPPDVSASVIWEPSKGHVGEGRYFHTESLFRGSTLGHMSGIRNGEGPFLDWSSRED